MIALAAGAARQRDSTPQRPPPPSANSSTAAISRTCTRALCARSMMRCCRNLVKVRLTVSIVNPRKSPMSARVIGKSIVAASLPIARVPTRHREQEGSDTLDRAALTGRQQEIVRGCQLLRDGLVKAQPESRVVARSLLHCAPLQATDTRRLGCLGVELVSVETAKAEQIAGIGEPQNLAPAVRHHFVETDCTAFDPVEVRSLVTLHEDVLFGIDRTHGSTPKICIEGLWRGHGRPNRSMAGEDNRMG